MISPLTWLWNIRHKGLLKETTQLVQLHLFFRHDLGIKQEFSARALKGVLKALKGQKMVDFKLQQQDNKPVYKGGAMGKKLLLVLAMLLTSVSMCFAGWVNGYTRKDGTSVQGYYRSDSNGTVTDNYSYKGNTNPYTGERGTNYYRHSPSSEYYQGN